MLVSLKGQKVKRPEPRELSNHLVDVKVCHELL